MAITLRQNLTRRVTNAEMDANFTALENSNGINFTQSGIGAIAGPVQTELRYFVRPEQFGAVRDGTTDDSAAFVAAQAAIAATGGEIRITRGKYAVNLTLTTPNIRIVGETHGADRTGAPGIEDCALVPFNTANPVLQVANDSAIVSGVELENLGIYGANTGTTGLKLDGGCRKNIFRNITIHGFTTYGLDILGGTSFGTHNNHFSGLNVICPAAGCTAGIRIISNNTNGAAGNSISQFSISGPGTSGYALIVDSADLLVTNGWIQVAADHGVQFKNTNSYSPALNGGPVVIDSDSSSDVLVENDFSAELMAANYLRGLFLVDGLIENNAAATASLVAKRGHLYQAQLYQPYAVSNLYLVNTSNPDLTNVKLTVGSGATPSLTIAAASGAMTLQPDGGTGNGTLTVNGVIDCTANTPRMRMAGTQVMAARKTGWTAATGTAARTTYATYTAQNITNPPTEAEVQAIDDHVLILSQRLKALLDDLISHGMIGT